MLYRLCCIFVVLGCCAAAGGGAGRVLTLPGDMHALALSSIDLVYKEEFKQAQAVAKRIIKDYPAHPAGYFFLAAVLDAHMEHLQSNDDEIEFYRYCDIAIGKGEEMLDKTPDDLWAKFFIGGANGARGTYESRYSRWITAFRYGWQGVAIFKDLLQKDSTLHDARMGIAVYDYWRSAMMKMLWWMPGVEDKREESIKELTAVMEDGVYVREAAAKQLISILNNEKRYAEALALSEKMLQQYPAFLVFHWGKAESLVGLGRWADAEKGLKYILKRIEGEGAKGNYNEILCRYYLAKIYLEQKRYPLCVYECNTIAACRIDADTRKRLEKHLADVVDLKKQAEEGERRERQNLLKTERQPQTPRTPF